jgi:predicted metal-dependent hydrolase
VPSALPETIATAGLTFTVRQSSGRRSIGITVDRDGGLVIHAPTDCSAEALAEFADGKRMWIYTKLAEKDLLLSPRPVKELVNGEGFAYLGRSSRLQLVENESAGVRLYRGRLTVPAESVRRGDGTGSIIGWYRSCALRWFSGRIPGWAVRMGVEPGDIDVRDLGYRWGSLGTSKRINFHWATIQLPPRLVDYVIVHELAHITHPSHTPAFWADVERAMPDYRLAKDDLARVGAGLWLGDTNWANPT